MALSAPLEAVLKQPAVVVFTAVEIIAPTFTLRILDGSSEITIDGNLYTGGDETYGAITAIDGLGDGITDEAPACTITLNPPTNVGTAAIANPTVQGSQVSVWSGALDATSGGYVDKYLWFFGQVDQAVVKIGKGARQVTIECVTAWEAFFEQDTGVRLSNSWHQYVWPEERGLEFVTDLNRTVLWGQKGSNTPPNVAPRIDSVVTSFFGHH